MKSVATIFLACSISLTGLACSESSLGLREETPPLETPSEETPPEETPGSPVDAQIAFVSDRDGSPHIYLARADGSGVTRLVAGERPAWSWDGRRIAFQRNEVIHVVNADGSNEKRLVGGFNPSWSPDGGSIVFDKLVGIFVIDLATSRVAQLIRSDFVPVEAPEGGEPWVGMSAWSPDGRSIAFVRGSFYEPWFIYVMNVDGSDPRRLDAAGEDPAWSPDGSTIAFGSSFGVGTVSVNGSDVRDYIGGTSMLPLGGVNRPLNPDWSPDGDRIAFNMFSSPPTDESSPFGTRMRIFVVTEGGPVRQLIPEAVAPALPSYRDYDPAWTRVSSEGGQWDY